MGKLKQKMDITEKELEFFENNFDEIFEKVGCFGTRSIFVFVTMYIVIMFGAMNIGGTVFLAADMDYQCNLDLNVEQTISKKCNFNWTDDVLQRISPVVENKTSKCSRFSDSELLNFTCDYWTSTSPTTPSGKSEACTGWKYDQSTFESTIISDFNLVCNNKWKTNVSQLLLMFGVLIGALVVGVGSDRFGRRILFIISLILLMVTSIASSLVKDYWLFSMVRVLVGLASIGLCVSGYVYAMEVMVSKYRVLF
uniref:Major facilitator superfamily (MFS) profile domain-containing protein n=1 Tax=Ciona savignyi TaxID=51511 RepID=H2Y4B4_CIOSA